VLSCGLSGPLVAPAAAREQAYLADLADADAPLQIGGPHSGWNEQILDLRHVWSSRRNVSPETALRGTHGCRLCCGPHILLDLPAYEEQGARLRLINAALSWLLSLVSVERSRGYTQEAPRILLTYEVASASSSQLASRDLARQIRDVLQGLEIAIADATIFSDQAAPIVEFANSSVFRAARWLCTEATFISAGAGRSVRRLTSACGRLRLSSSLRAARSAASPKGGGGHQVTSPSLPLRPRCSR
jgi:hypothetical protein